MKEIRYAILVFAAIVSLFWSGYAIGNHTANVRATARIDALQESYDEQLRYAEQSRRIAEEQYDEARSALVEAGAEVTELAIDIGTSLSDVRDGRELLRQISASVDRLVQLARSLDRKLNAGESAGESTDPTE